MGDITSLDDYRPHVQTVDPVTQVAMVFPVSMLEDIATGKLPVQDNASTRAIYHMLYEQLTARQDSD